MLQNGLKIRTNIFFEKWLAWLYFIALGSGTIGKPVLSMLAYSGVRFETEHDYLLLPSAFKESMISNLSDQPKKDSSILSSSGQEILRNLSLKTNSD